ncbi:hypothetical protein BDZ89DRAFT_1108990 [Hymenopellis radicata]|nr:hypothetical protein BDZ89DRAFT_1108990 [Hymenopellis radicata]
MIAWPLFLIIVLLGAYGARWRKAPYSHPCTSDARRSLIQQSCRINHTLPFEILSHIFDFLDKDDLHSARSVCSRWNLICRGKLPTVIRLVGAGDMDAAGKALDNVFSYLKEARLIDSDVIVSKELVILHIIHDDSTFSTPLSLWGGRMKLVTTLVVNGNGPHLPAGIPFERLKTLDTHFSRLPANLTSDTHYREITTLVMSGLEASIPDLAAILSLPQLHTLSLPRLRITEDPPEHPLKGPDSLRRFAVSSWIGDLSPLRPVFDIPSLEYLEIWFCPLPCYFPQTPSALRNLRKLRMVEICTTRAADAVAESRLLAGLTTLKKLEVVATGWRTLDRTEIVLQLDTMLIMVSQRVGASRR